MERRKLPRIGNTLRARASIAPREDKLVPVIVSHRMISPKEEIHEIHVLKVYRIVKQQQKIIGELVYPS